MYLCDKYRTAIEYLLQCNVYAALRDCHFVGRQNLSIQMTYRWSSAIGILWESARTSHVLCSILHCIFVSELYMEISKVYVLILGLLQQNSIIPSILTRQIDVKHSCIILHVIRFQNLFFIVAYRNAITFPYLNSHWAYVIPYWCQ